MIKSSCENTVVKQQTGLKRNTIDKYYTSEDVVEECFTLITEHVSIEEGDMCIEPSAGNGSFIAHIKSNFDNYKFYDIEPEHSEIEELDYLSFTQESISDKYNRIHVVGNPPFGRQSSLAIKFIKKSCEFCYSISFILPRSFKKNSLKKHIPLYYHLVCEQDIPDNAFYVDGVEHDVPCVFQIWVKRDVKREVPKKLVPINYHFVKKDEEPDISFRRVGVNAGKIDREIDTKSVQSHYFIKFEKEIDNNVFDLLTSIEYGSKDHTVGPRSISKQELIREFNQILA